MTIRIAMWSGPRNLSTAMMRSWENRPDCEVVDEPFYAYYLNKTRADHPFFDEILAAQSSDYMTVAKELSETPVSSKLQYQKHMTHHMLPGCEMNWCRDIRHCFLIRDPAEVVNSYTNSMGQCSAEDIGIERQYELYEQISRISDQQIPVLDGNDVLKDPQTMIPALCEALNVPFYEQMLSWPPGRRDSDGVWAPHWYHSVEASTGFAPYQEKELNLTGAQIDVVEQCRPFYLKLREKRISG
ncbi:sulfotransferase-like domain-containing protein [Bowmanella dokdonensis]|uniref:HAD family hydrolase n=1 Tax=Bowmanella dokdonensis TaxID=751969 RepID=A0A939IQH2_9ALTE|nr:HAD family hydrolase [Bowmanella dokdonensis]MBN7825029.1 HAD family hydrolase [Bowmanella dokdonensis]